MSIHTLVGKEEIWCKAGHDLEATRGLAVAIRGICPKLLPEKFVFKLRTTQDY